jgi:serine/threonine protein kinase
MPCSRDIYAAEMRLEPATIMRIARGIAAAAAHLHSRGLLHGDLYAHNVLWDGQDGEAALTDFGASCALPLGGEGDLWQRTEVRAWGVLLDELLERCSLAPAVGRLIELQELARTCLRPDTRVGLQ